METHSRGNGRFTRGRPTKDCEISFSLYKTTDSLKITLYDDDLVQWLKTIPALRHSLQYVGMGYSFTWSISMDVLLPCYPDLRAKFTQYTEEGRSFDALELFVRHFLREGSVFATFGFENLHEKQILTDLHFHDLHSQYSSLSEDLDRVDEMVIEIDELGELSEALEPYKPYEPCDNIPLLPIWYSEESFRSQLKAAIAERDPTTVAELLATKHNGHRRVDVGMLCHAIRYHECTVFGHLLEHQATIQDELRYYEPLYRAAKTGCMDAVRQLLNHGADIEAGRSGPQWNISATPLTGAAAGGHLDIVRYLVEGGANVNGNGYKSPVAQAIKHRHADIVDYLLGAGADTPESILSLVMGTSQTLYCDSLARLITMMPDHTRQIPISRSAIFRYLVALLGTCARPASSGSLLYRDTTWTNSDGLIFYGWNDSGIDHCRPLAWRCHSDRLKHVLCTHRRSEYVATATFSMLVFYAVRTEHPEMGPDLCPALLDNLPRLLDPYGILNRNDLLQAVWSGLRVAHSHSMHDKSDFAPSCFCAARATLHAELIDLFRLDCKVTAAQRRSHAIATQLAHECSSLADERRTMARRLLAKIGRSHGKLLAAVAGNGASAGLIAFVEQMGTRSSTWRSGTRTIRNIAEGYMPSGLLDIINALRVADAMRSAIPRSDLVCSKEE